MNTHFPGPRTMLAAAVVSSALAVAGCSSGGTPPGPLSFASTPDMVETGQSNVLQVQVRASPDPPWQGTIAVELTVTRMGDGTPVDGLTVSMVPWMPAHAHGTSLVPQVAAKGGGKYLVTDVDLFMAGYWSLQTTFSGSENDYVAPGYNVP